MAISDFGKFWRDIVIFGLMALVIWVALFLLAAALPYVRNGSDIITNAKRSYSLHNQLFSPDAQVRILTFGNSKILAGINPAFLDPALAKDGVPGKIETFNEGLPGESRYVEYLESLLKTGIRPTDVVIQNTPTAQDHPVQLSDWIGHDKKVIDTLFPFRTLPRDLVLFFTLSHGHGGPVGFYREAKRDAANVGTDRGYYFIKGQSHYPHDQLPTDYSLPTDKPNFVYERTSDLSLPAYKKLIALSQTYHFKIIMIPSAYRTGEYAPSPILPPLRTEPNGVVAAGPDYIILPPQNFSDPVHTNKTGAAIYSGMLADILAPALKSEAH